MYPQIEAEKAADSLCELLETHVQVLSEMLSRSYTLSDIEQEVVILHDLLDSYKRRNELLGKLLDTEASPNSSVQKCEPLKDKRKIAERVDQAHDRAHKLMLRSAAMLITARRVIQQRTRTYKGYAPEICARCQGLGGSIESPCPACKGIGSVMVQQPSIECPRCHGTGKPTSWERLIYSSEECIICHSTGWALTKMPRKWDR